MGIAEDGFVKSFNIIIQFGAIASVLLIYRKRFTWNFSFYQKLFVAFLPAAVIGLLVKNKIDALLDSVTVVSWSLIIGGVILFLSDYFLKNSKKSQYSIENFPLSRCLILGLLQCIAFIPGASRAAVTILAGMILGLDRKEATEFSFFLAVPTLAGATFIKSLKVFRDFQSPEHLWLTLFGSVMSFVFASMAILFFVKIVSRYGFKYFGIYRIILGLVILYVI
jgi:undecaprenyl-diphosphatase